MPEYFFHLSLELFPDLHSSEYRSIAPPSLTNAFKVLKPFLRSPRPQNERDTTFDTRRRNPTSKLHSLPNQSSARSISEQFLPSSPSDHRLDHIQIEYVDMEQNSNDQVGSLEKQEKDISKSMGMSLSGAQTKGRYTAIESNETGPEWGIVHLYRDASETPGLYKDNPAYTLGADLRDVGNGAPVPKSQPAPLLPPARDEDCTTLCILAVPSYLSPADFLAFVGENTRNQVSHFRMIRTSRQNRYMVLMKFRNGKKAREWQADWDGKVFNSMEPETVHVVFIKNVEIMPTTANSDATPNSLQHGNLDGTSTFPTITNDPFIPSQPTTRPLAPPTPSLIELPTCPVCLERMDETTGLLTILCQHVFHCTCLEKWSGGGCPVCRYTHDDFSTRGVGASHKQKSKLKKKVEGYADEYEICDEPLECETCHSDVALWQCLICGFVGCGRYEAKHAYQHFEKTGHPFSMDLESKRVWDYVGDVYVHRIIQDASIPGEKLVEIPGRQRESTALEETDRDMDMAKMEGVALEYTHLLTSQLESQRVYFEEVVERAVDKAAEASKRADRAIDECDGLRIQLEKITFERDDVARRIPDLEAEHARLEKRAAKFEDMAKGVNTKYLEEKSLVSSLMERIKHLEETKLKTLEKKIQDLEEDNATKDLLMEGLRDEHRDAMMQISAQEKLREMVANGELEPEDLIGATIEAGPVPIIRKGKKPVRKEVQPSTAPPASSADNELANELRQRLNLDDGTVCKGQGWTDEAAAKVFDEFKAKLMEQGLLAEKEVGKRVDDTLNSEAKAQSTGPKKKKKGKGKK